MMALGWERLSHGGYVNFLKHMLEDEANLKTDGGSDRKSDSSSDHESSNGSNSSSDIQSIDSTYSNMKDANQQLMGLDKDKAQSERYLNRLFK